MAGKGDIDEGIKALIDSMNSTGWIKTISSCEGHNGEIPYVAFYCRANRINFLTRVLDTVEHDFFPMVMFECCLVHESEICGCQGDAPAGWMALHLKFNFYIRGERDRLVTKNLVFNSLAQHFNC